MSGSQSILIGHQAVHRAAPDRWRTTLVNPLIQPPDLKPRTFVPTGLAGQAGEHFNPVSGVSLEMFADIAGEVAARDDDSAHGTDLARRRGVDAADWLHACKVWNSRIATYPAVAERLMDLYRVAEAPTDVAS